MLIISQNQMKAMSAYVREQFEDRMFTHLRQNFAPQTRLLPDDELRARISAGIDRAEPYAVVASRDVRRFLEFETMYGVGFEKTPPRMWALSILRDPRLTGSQKMDKIDEYDLFTAKGKS